MASVAAAVLLQLDEKETMLDLIYSSYDTEELQGLSTSQLQSLYENIRYTKLSISQIEASMNYTCACSFLCDREEIIDVLKEMDRRFYLAQDLQWEFALLDRQRKGAITKSDAKFLFQMVYGDFFSKYKFDRLMQSRVVPDSDVAFEEIEVELCNIPTHDWIDELLVEEEREREEKEFQRRETERKNKEMEELKRREEEMKQQLEEEDRKMKELLEKRKIDEVEEKKKKQKEEEKKARQMEEDKTKKAEEQILKEQEKVQALEAERLRSLQEGEEMKKAKEEEEQRLKKAEEERLRDEERLREEERLKEEEENQFREAERLRAEEEVSNAAALEKEKDQQANDRALKNWKKAKEVGFKKIRQNRFQALHEAKSSREAEEALKEEEDAGAAEEQEKKAEEELQKAEVLLQQATTDEERRKAEEAKELAVSKTLKYRERRLRSSLKAAVKQRFRPKIDATVVEAKEAEIPALNPDIQNAEKVSDSIKCVEDLENAMVKRNLTEIESAVDKIKKNGYEKDHTVQLLDADKLVQKLRRLEKLKKEIMALDQRTISEIRSYKTPIPAIHEVMIATYVILGYKEKELKEWKFIQALLGRSGKEGLKRMCTTLDATKIDMSIASVAEKKYLSKHDLASITDVSAGAATFFVWSTAMIDEARSWNEDSEFRKKVEEKRKQEEEEAKRLQEAKASGAKKSEKVIRTGREAGNSEKKNTGTVSDGKNEKKGPARGLSPTPSRTKNLNSKEAKGTPPTGRKNLTPAKSRTKLSSSKGQKK